VVPLLASACFDCVCARISHATESCRTIMHVTNMREPMFFMGGRFHFAFDVNQLGMGFRYLR
jgi:hypothetical protein